MPRRFTSLRVRLPTTVALLLAACIGVVMFAAYRAVRTSVTAATAERLRGSSDRLASSFGTSIRRSLIDAQRFADTPAVKHWLATGANAAALTARLDSAERRGAQQYAAIELIRQDGQRLVAGDSAAATRAANQPLGASPFFVLHDSTQFALVAPMLASGDTVGRLVFVLRRIVGNANSASLLGDLVGSHASVLIGNADGSLWTDFFTTVPAPAGTGGLPQRLNSKAIVTAETVAALSRVPGTPWVIWIGQPRSLAIEAATTLISRLAVLGVIIILIGSAIAWWAMRRFTVPIDELAIAADGMAAGDYSRRLASADRGDEVGRMALAFNSMATRIESHSEALEGQVRERTQSLEQAMSDLRLAQEENVRRERLAMLGQLAGGVGHELRNPLGVMTNAVYVLETVLAQSDPMVGEYLGILKGQISLSEKLVADLLDFARTKPAQLAPVTVDSLVRHQVGRLGPIGPITVEYDLPADLPLVCVDPVQIGQVIFNLVTNAVQAIAPEAGTVCCLAHVEGNLVALDVRDTGPGIPPDVAARIFDPLFTTKARGLGLGLTVSRMLSENNGGDLTFVSKPGHGTTFTLRMPIATP